MKRQRKSFNKCYGVFRETPEGIVEGYIEHSFSMGFSNASVRHWNPRDAALWVRKLRATHKGKGYKIFAVNLNSPKSRFGLIDYSASFRAQNNADYRNLLFYVRSQGNMPTALFLDDCDK